MLFCKLPQMPLRGELASGARCVRARTTVTFPIDDHYNVLAPILKVYPKFCFISQHTTDSLRHLVCEIRENYLPPFRTNCFNA